VLSESLPLLCCAGPIRLAFTLRLVNGTKPHSGRLELLREGRWTPVVVTNAAARGAIAQVACRQLGFEDSLPATAEDPAAFGSPTGGSWLNISACAGSEVSLMDCTCGYPRLSNTTNTTDYVTEECTSSLVTPVDGKGGEAAACQLAITCPTSAGGHGAVLLAHCSTRVERSTVGCVQQVNLKLKSLVELCPPSLLLLIC